MSEQVIYGKNIHPGAGLVESNMYEHIYWPDQQKKTINQSETKLRVEINEAPNECYKPKCH